MIQTDDILELQQKAEEIDICIHPHGEDEFCLRSAIALKDLLNSFFKESDDESPLD